MQLRHYATLVTLLASVTSVAVAAQQPKSASSDERAVLDLEDAWAKGVVKRDAATFRRLLAPGFVYTEDDQVQNADQVIKGIVSGTDTVTSAVNEKLETHTFANTMIVTGWLVMRGRSAGKPFEHRYRFTDTWVKRNGQWQIVAAQDYLVPAGRR